MKSIGKYEVLDEIGASVAGTTYRARDTFRKRELALKVLNAIPTLDAAAKDAFYRDLSLSADLTHRHLAKIVDLGEVEGQIYIATELLTGSDLRGLMAGNRELSIAQKIGILAQVCEGLAFAHSRDVVHGAIKPTNIFVDGNNDVTILDLGTAKWQSLVLAAGGAADGLLPNYFAPEQILGQTVDSKSDLFSLSVVAYEFLGGRYPFQVPVSLIPREIVHSEPESLRKLNPDFPEGLEQLLLRGLKKKPEERLQTAEEFAAGLYGIAQQLRRAPAAPVPAPVSAPASPPTSSEAPETPAAFKPGEPEVKTPRRQDVQATAAEQPWTARSYVANPVNRSDEKAALPPPAGSAPETAAQPAPPPAPRTASYAPPLRTGPHASIPPMNAPVRSNSMAAPAPSKAPNRIQRKPAQAKPLKRRVLAVVLGAVLGIYVIVNYISHQGLRASQNQNAKSDQGVSPKASVPDVKRNSERAAEAPVESAPAPATETPADVEPAQPEPKAEAKAEQILRKQVKTFWESGNYAEAMRLVDQVLASNPANGEARTWKKKIRAAQEAEAAIK